MRVLKEIRSFAVTTALILVGVASSVHAGLPTVLIFGPSPVQNLTSTGLGTPGAAQTITITLSPNGQTATGGRLQSLGFTGTNATDFAIIPGGTCAVGTTVLSPITSTTGQSCTVNVRYTPSSSAIENALLTASCQPVTLIGGFSVNCNGTVGSIASLLGSLMLAVVAAPIPALSAPMLTALSLSLLVLGAFVSLRRPSRRR